MTERAREMISDPKALRALSHPTRWSLVDLLGLEPTATATRCAEYTGESVASCSYHLNMLAKYGFVEQAGDGKGRERPWKLVNRSQSWRLEGLDTEAAMAAETLTEVFLDHENTRAKDWVRRSTQEPVEWQRAAEITGTTVHVTVEQLVELNARIRELIEPYTGDRLDPADRPEGARAVRMLLTTWLPRTS